MDHPLVGQEQKDLRQRVVQLLKSSYSVRRSSNIVFVCGGNKKTNMRSRFRNYCAKNAIEFEIFFPEFAIENALLNDNLGQFDLTDFETLISELSLAIVVFPEAPGSYAETGYFSSIDKISERCILVLDQKHQSKDSFISLGPAKKISQKSYYFPNIELDYKNPNFSVITERIKRKYDKKNRKNLNIKNIKDINTFELSCLVHEIVNILTVSKIDDIIYIMRSIFGTTFSVKKIIQITSILTGAKYLNIIGQYGHLSINRKKGSLLKLVDGQVSIGREIRLLLTELYQYGDDDFRCLIEASQTC